MFFVDLKYSMGRRFVTSFHMQPVKMRARDFIVSRTMMQDPSGHHCARDIFAVTYLIQDYFRGKRYITKDEKIFETEAHLKFQSR